MLTRRGVLVVLASAAALSLVLAAVWVRSSSAQTQHTQSNTVTVPAADRFVPFAITIHAGDTVMWVNQDADDHTVVSNDAFNTAGHKGTDQLLPASGGTFQLRFDHPGVFPYYCRFHARLDGYHQPKAPGPDGGIQDPNGNYGTPMNGVITVVP